MGLKQADIFNPDGSIKQNAFIHDRKTGKPNTLYLKPVQTELLLYRQWLLDHKLESEWLFPSIQHPERHITEKQFYKIMSKVGDLLSINYLGTHTMRKTGAYRVYTQSNYNIGLVMHLLNHSSEAMTLAYLGLDQASTETMLDQIDFMVISRPIETRSMCTYTPLKISGGFVLKICLISCLRQQLKIQIKLTKINLI